MNDELMKYARGFISEVGPNLYEINCDNGLMLEYVGNSLKKQIVKAKQKFIESGKRLGEEDLFLVRTMEKLPDDLVYRSFAHRGLYTTMRNPFERLLEDRGMSSDEIKSCEIVCPIYRDTVHFAVNGIVSNVWYSDDFTNRGIAVIEPLEDHLNEKLVNLNPVDTMIDVGKSDEPISQNAVFIIEKNLYNKLSSDMVRKLNGRKIVLFDSSKYKDLNNDSSYILPLEIVTDLVICNMGYLPQHSRGQTSLNVETYTIDGDYYSDKNYLEAFTNLIDKISYEKLGVGYYNIPEELKEKREYDKDRFGIYHWDTKYYEEEQSINYNNRLIYIEKYLNMLREKLGLPDNMFNYIYKRYCRYVDLNYSKAAYGSLGHHHISLINFEDAQHFIDRVSLEKFIELTKEFNISEQNKLEQEERNYKISVMMDDFNNIDCDTNKVHV